MRGSRSWSRWCVAFATWLCALAWVPAGVLAEDAAVDAGIVAEAIAEIAEPAEEEEVALPQQDIQVGMYINQLPSIDLRMNQFTIDFWIWFRWRGPASENPADTFEIIGGRINARMNPIRRTLPDGFEYSAVRINATITEHWDLTRYPFDNHEVGIEIEDALHEEPLWRYVSDTENTGIDPDLLVSGWQVGDFQTAVSTHAYHSNYGDTTLAAHAESEYSRFTFTLNLQRVGGARFFKVFFALFIATLAAWCSFFIRPRDASPRVSVSVGGLFASAASSIAINNQLPDSNAITMADQVVFLSLGTILFCLLGTVLALYFHYNGEEEKHRRLDKASAAIVPVAFLAILAWIITTA